MEVTEDGLEPVESPPFVGKEEQDGVVAQIQSLKGVEHTAHVFIEAFHHRGIGGVCPDGSRPKLL